MSNRMHEHVHDRYIFEDARNRIGHRSERIVESQMRRNVRYPRSQPCRRTLNYGLGALQLLCIFDVFSIGPPFAKSKSIVILHGDTPMSPGHVYIGPHIYMYTPMWHTFARDQRASSTKFEIRGINALIRPTCDHKILGDRSNVCLKSRDERQ